LGSANPIAEPTAASLAPLRRVLSAFAQYNPRVSYVQGMNFIASGLLSALPETEAFWMLSLVVSLWLPDHFSEDMFGNHIDCRVLARLVAERLPRLDVRMRELEVSAQLLTARWFLCLWASVLPLPALFRVWDVLFVGGPPMALQLALSCMHLIEEAVLVSADMGAALAAVKETLRAESDGEQLVRLTLSMPYLSAQQLAAWRQLELRRLVDETARNESHRQLQSLQRASGLSAAEVEHMANLCGVSPAAEAARQATAAAARRVTTAGAPPALALSGELEREITHESQWLLLSLDLSVFACVVHALLPRWNARSRFVHRTFELFCQHAQPADHGARRTTTTSPSAAAASRFESATSAAAAAIGSRGAASTALPKPLPPPPLNEARSLRLTFAGLVSGLGWLLRGTSRRRAHLCYLYFARGPQQSVRRADFIAGLCETYALFHSETGASVTEAREAEHFVDLMFELWDESGAGELTPQLFVNAAHQHPLLVQAFNLEQLEPPPPTPPADAHGGQRSLLPLGAAARAEVAAHGGLNGRGARPSREGSNAAAATIGICDATAMGATLQSTPPRKCRGETGLAELLAGESPGIVEPAGLLLSPSNLNFLAEEYFAQPG
jgi:hypothetical protein